MTREEIIDFCEMKSQLEPENEDFFNYIIKSLEKEPCEDAISRAHLLSEIASLKKSPWYNDNTNGAAMIRKDAVIVIEDLCIKSEPSVVPKPCKDAISRAAAHELIRGLTRWNVVKEDYKSVGLLYDDVQFGLDGLPPVQLKPETTTNCNEDYADCDQFVCSECGIELQEWVQVERDEDDGDITYHEYTMKYCPNCGKEIEEEKEDD